MCLVFAPAGIFRPSGTNVGKYPHRGGGKVGTIKLYGHDNAKFRVITVEIKVMLRREQSRELGVVPSYIHE